MEKSWATSTYQAKCRHKEKRGAPARHLHPPGAQTSTNFPQLVVAALRTINPPGIRLTARPSPSATQAKRIQRTPWLLTELTVEDWRTEEPGRLQLLLQVGWDWVGSRWQQSGYLRVNPSIEICRVIVVNGFRSRLSDNWRAQWSQRSDLYGASGLSAL